MKPDNLQQLKKFLKDFIDKMVAKNTSYQIEPIVDHLVVVY
jgi:hypothetical protein